MQMSMNNIYEAQKVLIQFIVLFILSYYIYFILNLYYLFYLFCYIKFI